MNQERAFILFDYYYYYYKIDSIKYTYSIRLQYINKAINPLEKKIPNSRPAVGRSIWTRWGL